MSSFEEGSVVAGKYRLESPLARGGMGEIWTGRHITLDMRVAVKLMDATQRETAEGWTRFEREARVIAQIKSPHVVQIYDYGVEIDTPYLVMELLQGEDLGHRLRRAGPMSIAETERVVSQVAKALIKAHEAGVVHRDLKPANVFLAKGDEGEIVKLLDFGIVKTLGEVDANEATATGVVLGSVHYMSPEQARGLRTLDHRADLWSLGVITYRMLSGQLPFQGDQVGDLIVKICAEPIPPLSSLVPAYGGAFDAFFAKALARSPAQRFSTARDLAAAFSAIAASMSSRAEPPPIATAPPITLDPLSAARAQTAPSIASASFAAIAAPPIAHQTLLMPGARPPSHPSYGTLSNASPTADIPAPKPGRSALTAVIAAVAVVLVAALAVVLVLSLRSKDPSPSTASAIEAPRSAAPVETASATPSAEPIIAPSSALPPAPTANASPSAKSPTKAAPKASAKGSPNSVLGF